jgi:hypothetical protein
MGLIYALVLLILLFGARRTYRKHRKGHGKYLAAVAFLLLPVLYFGFPPTVIDSLPTGMKQENAQRLLLASGATEEECDYLLSGPSCTFLYLEWPQIPLAGGHAVYILFNRHWEILEYRAGYSYENRRQRRYSEKELTERVAQNERRSQYALGHFFLREGKTQNAIPWLLAAAEQGDTAAQLTLGDLSFRGIKVEKNDEEAYFWFSIAAEAPQDQKNGDIWYVFLKDDAAAKLTPREIDSVNKRIEDWKKTHPPSRWL